jgi:hypothetical protein
MVKEKERKTEYNHGIYVRLLNRFNDLATELLNKIDFRDLVKPVDSSTHQDIEFLYFTHRYEAGVKLEKLVNNKSLKNRVMAFTMLAHKVKEGPATATAKSTEVVSKQNNSTQPREEAQPAEGSTEMPDLGGTNLASRMKGRILQVLMRNITAGARPAFLRWHMRTHPEFVTTKC